MATREAAIAAVRFGIGAKPGELERIGDARAWAARQVDRPDAFQIPSAGLPTSADAGAALEAYFGARETRREVAEAKTPQEAERAVARPLQAVNQLALKEAEARFAKALNTNDGYAERLAWFWGNHFTVAATKALTIPFVGVFEREAIRARLTGRFEDLLLAAIRHPGMLLYLDQAQSIGPSSPVARRREGGLNENLAREALELHTLGAQGGYTQADVTEFAKALTGWTIVGRRTQRFAQGGRPGDFVFIEAIHEPGARTVLGKRYPEGGVEQATAILKDLAAHPATARRIATKLARHLTQDVPASASVALLEKAFRDSGGHLPTLHRAALEMPEAWSPELRKVKSPNEFIVSALRMVGVPEVSPRAIAGAYDLLGQQIYRAPSPEGWPDDAASWAAPDALIKRVEWSQALAERVPVRGRPEALAGASLGPLLSARTAEAIRRAESPAQGLALALMSPEFQRR